MANDFFRLPKGGFAETVVGSLTPVADSLRDLQARLGARPYGVFLVWTRWTGGARGDGQEEVDREVQLLPTPYVPDFEQVDRKLTPVGTLEEGTVTVREVSPRYSEDFLLGRGARGEPVPDDQSFYWEVRFDGQGPRRRFTVEGAPGYRALDFEWRVRLRRAHDDRERSGEPR